MSRPVLHRRMILGISGASGTAYGVAALRMLRELDVETHLVMTRSAMVTLAHEVDLKVREVQRQGHDRDDDDAATAE